MENERVCANSPFHSAVCLHAMIRAVAHLVHDYGNTCDLEKTGAPTLLDVMAERAEELVHMLDSPTYWGAKND